MRKIALVSVALAVFGFSSWAISSLLGPNARAGEAETTRQRQGAAQQAIAKNYPQPRPQPALEVPGRLGFVIEVDPDKPNADLRRRIAQELSRVNPIPTPRLAHFHWLDNPSMRVDGWHGRIEQMVSTPRGWIATILVTPYVTSSIGASTTVVDHFLERYESVDGTLRLLGVAVPPSASPGSYLTD